MTFGSPSVSGTAKNTAALQRDAPTSQAGNLLRAATRSDDATTGDDGAKVGHEGLRPVGEATVDGRVCRVSLVCPHMGGTLAWNDAEESWDCPLHGSRFTADGTLLEGPAVDDLKRR